MADTEQVKEKGSLSINSENMFPIIKKWLYSDHDIFVRELISNGCDAITKLHKLSVMGDFELPEGYKPRIDVIVNPDEKTMQFIDNGLGMTADEVKQYINNVAFSGAADFLEKYKDKANDDQIIGHFGLGFYSAFMVSELVEIDTLSWQKDAKPVHWECDGGSEYAMGDGTRTRFGTTITLHLMDDCLEFANYYKAREVIQKYCSFMPTEIYLTDAVSKDTVTIKESERRPDDVILEELPPEEKKDEASKDAADNTGAPIPNDDPNKAEDQSDADKTDAEDKGTEAETKNKPAEPAPEKRYKIRKRPELMNDIHPLWTKAPQDCTDEEYKEFYRKVFNDYKEPLFWIHLNMDYPFNLKGILYFPKINLEYESAEGVIKLYNSQVFVADNIKEVIPEYLMLLKGVIDCPDLPLNVSRSALQNDGFVKKISDYITKKVADKLAGMCRTDRENYEKYWDDIAPFIKYGCLKDEKFCERITNFILFRDLDGKYHALPEALEINVDAGKKDADDKKAAETKEDDKPKDRTIYYVTNPDQQGQYTALFRAHGMQAFILDHTIDQPFISQLEMKNEGLHFARVDAAVQDGLKDDAKEDEAQHKKDEEAVTKAIRTALKDEKLKVQLTRLKDANVSAVLTVDEQARRMQDMMKMYSANGMDLGSMDEYVKEGQTLVLNESHPLVQYILKNPDGQPSTMICEQLYALAKLQNAPLAPNEMASFVDRSNRILEMLANGSADSAEGSSADRADGSTAETAADTEDHEAEGPKDTGAEEPADHA